ncbi:[protein-PII] uridylyltransferase [Brackiella oedipodis]|uniref:[protein-PII] uridylyltransferase n=1 Tax=Brackiella oedipodis TaxID=124225 RepID=UPI00048C73F1|nr:[protein-PII] uridylyltransferase [Brackiella oedipodis]
MDKFQQLQALRQIIAQQQADAITLYQNKRLRPDNLLITLRKHIDQALKQLHALVPLPHQASLCAVGGYGRGELYPYSDIDLLILLRKPASAPEQEQLEQFISSLWDMGLHVGHSVRTLDDCLEQAEQDITVATSLLEMRFLLGDKRLYRQLFGRFRAQLNPKRFFLDKKLELQKRHAQYKDTPFELEPNCKESPGGLRDLQTLQWLASACGIAPGWRNLHDANLMTEAEVKQIQKIEHALQRLRIEVHLLQKKRDDRLLFHLQPQLAEVYHIKKHMSKRPSEVFMQRYYLNAKIAYILTQFTMQNMELMLFKDHRGEQIIDEDFKSVGSLLDVRYQDIFQRKPQLLLKIFLVLQQHPDLSNFTVNAQRLIYSSRHQIDAQFRKNPINHWLFLQILKQRSGIVHALRRMAFLDILPAYIPAFRKITGQMQHDLVHIYTVDQHSLMVLRNIRRFTMAEFAQDHPLANRLAAEFDKIWLLYLAALFHDIAKGRGGDHSLLGAQEVKKFAQAHNLNQDEVNLLEFLVKYHLLMSMTAQKRDLSDAKVIQQFCDIVKTPYRLAALYMLTIADMRGTSPRVWNAWKSKLLQNLYEIALSVFNGKQMDREAILTLRQKKAIQLLEAQGIGQAEREAFWRSMGEAYFLRTQASDIAWHTRKLFDKLPYTDTIVRARELESQSDLQVMVFTKDQASLFEHIVRFFYEQKINVIEAQIHTSNNGYVLDSFILERPQHLEAPTDNYLRELEKGLHDRLQNQTALPTDLVRYQPTIPIYSSVRRSRTFPIKPRLVLETDELANAWRLQIMTTDSPGILYALAQLFNKHKVNLHMARILTLGERVEDVFVIDGDILKEPRLQLPFEHDIMETLNSFLPQSVSNNN